MARPVQPTIGRIVLFHAVHDDYPAIVTGLVDKPRLVVDLTVFPNRSLPFNVNEVAFGSPVGHWGWPERGE